MITSKQAGAVTTIVHDYSGDGTQGWAVEKGFVPKPIGGAFVQYEVHRHGINKGKPTNVYTDIRVMPLIHAPDVSGL